jgi:hypothetical protein
MAHYAREKTVICFEECRDLLLAFPWGSMFAFIGQLVGFILALMTRGTVNVALDTIGAGASKARTTSTLLFVAFVLTFLVNLLALSLGFLGATKTRTMLFGEHAAQRQQGGALGFLQALGGPCMSKVVLVLLQSTIIFLQAMSYFFLTIMVTLLFLTKMCKIGAEGQQATMSFIALATGTDADKTAAGKLGRFLANLDMNAYCAKRDELGGFGKASSLLIAGCVVAVLSQVMMLVSTAAEKERMSLEMAGISAGSRNVMTSESRPDDRSVELKQGFNYAL